ncbi:MAG TPA: biotin/lipoyl-containing protein [Pyrinomonadaceae bacterium]|jgi:biotin carboxyl carrier protein|nr:biotin/lipoyl-containing protein [Pyrinomonadaceae bacterium]
MKLNASIEGEKVTLEVRREGERVFAEVGGRRYELEARALGEGEYLLLCEGRVYECRVGAARGATGNVRGTLVVAVGAREYAVTLTDTKHLRGARVAGGHDAGRAQVSAPMPGKVVRVLVERGQEVEAGDGVVVVEAMKMQNELKSPKAGRVAELRAETGATVNAGDVLAVIE